MNLHKHRHNPCVSRNYLLRFLGFLIYPQKLYFHHDDSGVCKQCNTPIKTPNAYYHLGCKLAYLIAGIGIVYLVRWLNLHKIIAVPLILGLVYLFDRLASAFVLTVFEWEPYDIDNYDFGNSCFLASKNSNSKWRFVLYGIVMAVFIINFL